MMWRFCLFILVVGLSHDVSKATCVSRGRFPNNDEADCRGYTMCLPMGGAFMQYNLTCPLGSVYSHSEQQCTTSTTYSCLSNYTCNATGNFESDNSDCRSYVACVMGLTDLVSARQVDCPLSQVFSPGVGCVNMTEYVCNPVAETTVTEVLVTESAVVTEGSFRFSSEVPMKSGGERSRVLVMLLLACLIKSV